MEALTDFFQGFAQRLGLSGVTAALGGAVAAGLLSLMSANVRRAVGSVGERFAGFFKARSRLKRVNDAVSGDGLWLTPPISRPDGYAEFYNDPYPILTVANLKGGVGKTTTAANLGAYFAAERGERVLFIDLDYQGSLSSMLLTTAQRIPARNGRSVASRVVSGEFTVDQLDVIRVPVRHTAMKSAWAIPAYYDLANAENREMVHWLSQEKLDDVRFRLANLLHQPRQSRLFDRVIIDAPPRLTTGTIQALCASTHVLIPTVLDNLSGEAISSFVRELLDRRDRLWPNLKFVGVSGQLVSRNLAAWREEHADASPEEMLQQLTASERAGLTRAKRAVEDERKSYKRKAGQPAPAIPILPADTFIAKRAAIAESAGQSVAFLDVGNDLKAMFRTLGTEVETRMSADGVY